jgi:hypothetical protein
MGSAIDPWVIGLVDPVGDPSAVLVDHLTFDCAERDPRAHAPVSYRASEFSSCGVGRAVSLRHPRAARHGHGTRGGSGTRQAHG